MQEDLIRTSVDLGCVYAAGFSFDGGFSELAFEGFFFFTSGRSLAHQGDQLDVFIYLIA